MVWPKKTDFNFEPPEGFCDSAENLLCGLLPKSPFLIHFNFGETHEGALETKKVQDDFLRDLPPESRVDPAKIKVPPCHPDDAAIREDLALHHDLISGMDQRIGKVLELLEATGTVENAIVINVGDGGRPFPRAKCWL